MNIKYKIIYNFDFLLNNKMLNLVYLPILGREAISLYYELYNQAQLAKELGSNISQFKKDLIHVLKITNDKFDTSIKLLEGIGLLNTYIDSNKQDLFLYKIQEALSWKDFNKNHYLVQLLKMSIDNIAYEKLRFTFEGYDETIGLTNISETFDNVFKIQTEKGIDFDFIYSLIQKRNGELITLKQETKDIINNAYKKYNLGSNELVSAIIGSVIKQNNKIEIDNTLLVLEIKKILDAKTITNLNENIKINRNSKIFLENINIDDFKYIINDYKTLNSEQYLSCLQKHSLSEIEVNCINTLRKEYKLPDFIINVIIDYCIFVNNGRLEPAYLSRIALSINRLNLTSVDGILNHLRKACSRKNKYLNNNKFEEVDW